MLSSGVSSLHGTTRSPWDESLTTGGSSSGAGAAAAAGYGPLHVGTDIGGSIRLPGTWLGLTTLKPSAGGSRSTRPTSGRVAGPITRSADAALLLSVISRPTHATGRACRRELFDPRPTALRPGEAGASACSPDAGCGFPVDPAVRGRGRRGRPRLRVGRRTIVEPSGAVHCAPRGSRTSTSSGACAPSSSSRPSTRPADGRVLPFVRRWAEAACSVDGTRRAAATTRASWRCSGPRSPRRVRSTSCCRRSRR